MIWFAVLLLASAEGFKITDHSPSKVSVFAVLLLASAEGLTVTDHSPSKLSVFAVLLLASADAFKSHRSQSQ